ncbi:type II toxin-antitoxin system VapC family toxin [Inquilinus limosus]|uniref:DNA-binding protein n=1 Tax=Inquilinus limosus TaxID=171674 RepID=A0A211ZHL0_9PROT|nr:type II toxin-antitoxin system VapC family toxin [Inquilinus limosus]OWJ64723.1 DNA-binding protein [Inquilinus limosus]
MTLVDTNVLLDIVTGDPAWAKWSLEQLEAAAERGPLLINDVIYAELSIRYPRIDELDTFVDGAGLDVLPMTRPALFRAGKAFAEYRKAGGKRDRILPDFFIGSQAEVSRLPILTRDVERYRTYFPTVILISPTSAVGS